LRLVPELDMFPPGVLPLLASYIPIGVEIFGEETVLLGTVERIALLDMFNGGDPAVNIMLKLIYRGSRDGHGGRQFHVHCDHKGPTLVVVRSKGYPNIFGGFTTVQWSLLHTGYQAKNPQDAGWIFTLHSGHGRPMKFENSNS